MKVRITNNLWTNTDWWDQLVKTADTIALKKHDAKKSDIYLNVVNKKVPEIQLINLLEDFHVAALNKVETFDVQGWFNRYKKQSKKRAEK